MTGDSSWEAVHTNKLQDAAVSSQKQHFQSLVCLKKDVGPSRPSTIQEVSEKCLKLVSLCDTLDQSLYGDISMECSLHGYDILQLCTELLQLVDLKTDIITRHLGLVVDYNNSCNKLGQIENNIQSQANTGAAAQDFSGEIKIILDSFLVKGRACLDNSSDMASPAG